VPELWTLGGTERFMQSSTSQNSVTNIQNLGWRVFMLVVGYLTVLAGCSLFFSLEMILLLLLGFVVIIFASRRLPQPPTTWRSVLFVLVGCVAIIGILSFFGDERIRQWRPHPGGYIPAWFACCSAFRQIYWIYKNH
jgi:hypothetical protein